MSSLSAARAPLRTDPDQRQEAAALQSRIVAVQSALASLDVTAEQMRSRRQILDNRRTELEALVAQSRTALAEAEEAAHRTAAQQTARREQLLAEAAQLERRIAELQASIAGAQQAIAVRAAKENNGPQMVECVREGVLLQPQHVMVPSASLNDGTLALAVRRRGAYFVVRPDGFSSFVLARAVANATGTLIIAEPRAKDQP